MNEPRVVMQDLSLPHQVHLMFTGSRKTLAVSCTCTIHGPNSGYGVIEARSPFPAAEAVAAWRGWHERKGVAV